MLGKILLVIRDQALLNPADILQASALCIGLDGCGHPAHIIIELQQVRILIFKGGGHPEILFSEQLQQSGIPGRFQKLRE